MVEPKMMGQSNGQNGKESSCLLAAIAAAAAAAAAAVVVVVVVVVVGDVDDDACWLAKLWGEGCTDVSMYQAASVAVAKRRAHKRISPQVLLPCPITCTMEQKECSRSVH